MKAQHLSIFILALISISQLANAKCIDIFYLPTCPHCEQALSFLYNISTAYNITLHEYNVENTSVIPVFVNLSNYYSSGEGVPLIFVGNSAFIGFLYGNGSQQANPKLYIGYSSQLLNAINSANDSCPTLPFSCNSCYTVVAPQTAKKMQADENIYNVATAILLVVLIVAAAYLIQLIKNAHKKVR